MFLIEYYCSTQNKSNLEYKGNDFIIFSAIE